MNEETTPHVSQAPTWLVKRMEALRQMPSPTLQQVETSFRAAEAMRFNSENNPAKESK